MRKKSTIIAMLILVVTSIALMGCEGANTALETKETLEEIKSEVSGDEEQIEESETETEIQTEELLEDKDIKVYYGNAAADGLTYEEVTVEQMTADKVLSKLLLHNIVSIDTKIKNFEIADGDDGKIVKLDLSKQFSEYLTMMGSNGEYLIIASLTNTYLDAYDAVKLLLTVDGKPIKTDYGTYDDYLTMFAMEEADASIYYTLDSEEYKDEKCTIRYPQFTEMSDTDMMDRFNKQLKDTALLYVGDDGLANYDLDYEVMTESDDLISILFTGGFYYEEGAYPTKYMYTYNLDLKNGTNLRLSDYADIDEIITKLNSGEGFTLLDSDITLDDFMEYQNLDALGDYETLFKDYDYDMTGISFMPTGFSYQKDGKTVLVMEVNHVFGDYLLIQID